LRCVFQSRCVSSAAFSRTRNDAVVGRNQTASFGQKQVNISVQVAAGEFGRQRLPADDCIVEPAAYDAAPVVKLDRPVEVKDGADFFFQCGVSVSEEQLADRNHASQI
jgi:hypothetical protein